MFGLKKKHDELKQKIDWQLDTIKNLAKQIEDIENQIELKRREIGNLNGIIDMIDMGMEYTPTDILSSDAEKQIRCVQEDIAHNLEYGGYFHATRQYRIDGSVSKGEKFQKAYFDNLLMGIDSYIRCKEKSVTNENYERTLELITSAFNKFNRKASLLGFYIDDKYLEARIKIINLKLDLKCAKQNEREELREQKRKIAEEEKLRVEAEKEKQRLIAEKTRWEKIFGDAMTDDKRKEAKEKLAEIANRDADVDYRLANLKSGWVYVISNPALPNMVKIGVTRRLDFTKRVDELNAAGVPYNFVINGVTFSDDCFALETALHQYYDIVRVNKENRHKEFFRVDANDVLDVMKNKFNCELHFIKEEE